MQQLQYELASERRHHETQTTSFKQRIADLELQLIETRKEAEEYHKADIEKSVEISSLQNEVTKCETIVPAMKIGLDKQ